MLISFFLTFLSVKSPEARVDGADRSRLVEAIAATPGLGHALIYEPASATDPLLDGAAHPLLVLELRFSEIVDLEAALASSGPLQALAAPGAFPSLSGCAVSQQAMLTRSFPIPGAAFEVPAGTPRFSYLVSYEGSAEDLNTWLRHYLAKHVPIMAHFPGIRQIEVCTRLDWCGQLPWPRVDYMLRNKVVFDSAEALTAALHSPARHEMREDYHAFPPFSGRVSHYPMSMAAILPAGATPRA